MADNFFEGVVNSDITDKLDKYKELKNKYEELCEALVGIDATERYSHQEILSYVYNLKNIEERFYDSKKT
jgi:hypothetical protein